MKLYFAPRTRAVRPRWLLEELEVPYELVRVDMTTEAQSPAFRALSPLGDLPILVDEDVTLFDSTAICLHLADRFPEKGLAPSPRSPERAAYYQWVIFAETKLDPLVVELLQRSQLPAEQQGETAALRGRLDTLLTILERELDGRETLLGPRFSVADIVTASILHLAFSLKLLEGHPRLVEYAHLHAKRPAVRRALS